jgi:membrane protein
MIGRGTSGSQWNFVTFALAFLYCFGPSRAKPQWRWITSGSAVAAVSWIVVSILFAWYAENFGSFNKTYGSLGAIIGFMLWIWLSTIVVLIGAELNAETEHPNRPRYDDGETKAAGARGARMADTIGAPQE